MLNGNWFISQKMHQNKTSHYKTSDSQLNFASLDLFCSPLKFQKLALDFPVSFLAHIMDKKDSNNSSRHMCDRIKNAAVSVCPSFKPIRRVSHRQSSPNPALQTSQTKPTPHLRNNRIIEVHSRPDPQKFVKPGLESRHQKGDVVGIHFDFEKPKPSQHIVKVGSNFGMKSKANPEAESHRKTGVHIEDRFSDYINRAKNIFRNSTFVIADHGKDHQNDDEFSGKASSAGKDHKFNEFIDRAKKKFRTTSSIGGGRSISFK